MGVIKEPPPRTLGADDLRLLREVADRQQVTEVLFLYCRACDRLDVELMERCFWPDATACHGAYRGPAEGFWRGALHFLSRIKAGLHYATNVVVKVDGDLAYQEALFTAWQRLDKGPIKATPFETSPFAGPNPERHRDALFGGFAGHDEAFEEDAVFHGRYVNRFQRRNGEWRILNHVCFSEWVEWRRASERAPLNTDLTRRDRTDPAYWREGTWGM
jgi:hypothetical protein